MLRHLTEHTRAAPAARHGNSLTGVMVSAPVRMGRASPQAPVRAGNGRPAAITKRRRRGQALAEFALVAPIVLVLLIVVSDFARLFATAISVESAARDAAEVAAQEYLRNPPPTPAPASYYDGSATSIHGAAAKTVCDELGSLPNAGSGCSGIPVVACVHDGADPGCATQYPSGVVVPAGCPDLATGLPTNAQGGSSETSTWVEVRVCYRFSTLLSISQIGPIGLPFGDFYLERTRVFTVPNY